MANGKAVRVSSDGVQRVALSFSPLELCTLALALSEASEAKPQRSPAVYPSKHDLQVVRRLQKQFWTATKCAVLGPNADRVLAKAVRS